MKINWQSWKNVVNLTADVVRIKASAEHIEDQGQACGTAAQPGSGDFLYSVIDPQPLAFRNAG